MKEYLQPYLETPAQMRRFVEACDRDFEARMERSLRALSKQPDLRFLGLTGPTCSGKTTAARKMTEVLAARGITLHVISVDDFYFDKEYLIRRAHLDPDIEIDYDSEDTIDVEYFGEVTRSLQEGRTTALPRFDFRSGKRTEGPTIVPGPRDIFLFEGIQILYPGVNEILDCGSYQSFCIHPETAVRAGDRCFLPNEIRLLRRLVRDQRHRDTDPAFTLYLWESVRANEERSIFPHLGLCKTTIDSTMPYELGMLKPYLMPMLASLPEESIRKYETLFALREVLPLVQEIPSDTLTEQSLYKEFI